MFKHPSSIQKIFRYPGMNQNFRAVKIQLELYWRFSFTFVRKECDKLSIVHLFPQFWKKGNNKDRIHKSIITLHYNPQYLVTVRFNDDKIDHILLYIYRLLIFDNIFRLHQCIQNISLYILQGKFCITRVFVHSRQIASAEFVLLPIKYIPVYGDIFFRVFVIVEDILMQFRMRKHEQIESPQEENGVKICLRLNSYVNMANAF